MSVEFRVKHLSREISGMNLTSEVSRSAGTRKVKPGMLKPIWSKRELFDASIFYPFLSQKWKSQHRTVLVT